jgi:hypothetical protein
LDTFLVKGQKISKTKLLRRSFSQKTNEWICFSILTTRKYVKLELWFQVSSISELSGKNKQIRLLTFRIFVEFFLLYEFTFLKSYTVARVLKLNLGTVSGVSSYLFGRSRSEAGNFCLVLFNYWSNCFVVLFLFFSILFFSQWADYTATLLTFSYFWMVILDFYPSLVWKRPYHKKTKLDIFEK